MLNNQAAGENINYDPEQKIYYLHGEHALILADTDSPFYMAPGFQVVSSLWYDKDKMVQDLRKAKALAGTSTIITFSLARKLFSDRGIGPVWSTSGFLP